MRLSHIKLAGFKSFSDPVTLEFPAEKTAVVGPNGCGKSNVIDAVRWVLGESSASQMRSDIMEDVIFNGTETSPARGRAMVEMQFEDNNNSINGKYANLNGGGKTGQIRIKRILERERESKYYINDTPCRKKDISQIFAGMGITGKTDYAIISQGAVHNIVESKPEHVKSLIEEAADITGYLAKRKETLTHIRNTKDNLRSISGTLTELRSRVRNLERQAEQASLVKRNRNDLSKLKHDLTLAKYQELVDKQKQKKASIQKIIQDMDESKNKSALWQTTKEKDSLDLQEITSSNNKKLIEQRELISKITKIEAASEYTNQSLKNKEDELDRLNKELAEIDISLNQYQEDVVVMNQSLEKLSNSHRYSGHRGYREDKEDSKEVEVKELENNLIDANQKWEDNIKRSLELSKVSKELSSEIQQVHNKQEILRRQKAESIEQEQIYQTDAAELEVLTKDHKKLSVKLESQKQKLNNLNQKIKDNQQTIEKQEAAERSLANQELEHRTRMEEIEQEIKSVQLDENLGNLLSNLGISSSSFWAQTIDIAPKWERALDNAASSMLSAKMSDKLSSALRDLGKELQKSNKQKNINLSLIDKAVDERGESTEDFHGLQSLLQATKSNNRPAFLRHIYLCDSLDEAIKLQADLKSYQSLVTPDGTWLGKNWAVIGKQQSGYSLEKTKRAQNLKEQISSLEEKIQDMQSKLKGSEEQQKVDEKQAADMQKQIYQEENELAILGQQKDSKEQQVQAWQDRIKSEAGEKEHSKHLVETQKTLEKLNQELEQTQEEERILGSEQTSIEEERGHLIIQINQLKEELEEQSQGISKAQEERENLLTQISSLETKIADLKEDKIKNQAKERELTAEIVSTRKITKDEDEQVLRLSQENQRLSDDLKETQAQQEKLEKSISKSERQITSAEKETALLEQKLAQVRGDENELDLELEEIQKRMSPAELSGNKAEQSEHKAEQSEHKKTQGEQGINRQIENPQIINAKIKHLERELTRIGDVNMLALQEYEEEKQKYDNLSEQEEQINKALSNLNKAMKRIDRESKIKFDRTFKKIDKSFAQLFAILTNGGTARLEYDDEEGVRIMACPPGKRTNALSLLSGGEKTVAALAFIMSIFQLNPAPFCLLDEADAMLDDDNVIRFNEMIKEMAQSLGIQFILVTHSKLSMQQAKHLIGITMSEPGVSRVVSVDMEKALSFSQDIN